MKDKQTMKLLKYLQEHKEITQLDAFQEPLRIGRLSARIYDLREMGYNIGTKRRKNYAVYYLEEENGRQNAVHF